MPPRLSIKDSERRIQELVTPLLRPADRCRYCGEVVMSDDEGGFLEKSIIAIVTTLGSSNREEGCVFLLRQRSPIYLPPVLQALLPIYADFRISVAQTDSGQDMDSFGGPRSPPPGKKDFILSIQTNGQSASFHTLSMEVLQSLMIEVKRLMSIAQEENYTPTGPNHAWTQFYALNPESSIPEILPELEQQEGMLGPEEVKSFRLKNDWVRRQLAEREDEYVDWSSVSVFVGTYNVHNALPAESLAPWLSSRYRKGDLDPDFFVLGFQEVDLSAEAYVYSGTLREEEWCHAIENGLAARGLRTYEKVKSKQLVGILLVIYAKKEVIPDIKEIATDTAGVGIMGLMGNKGATTIRIRYKDSYICFVNSHLAAFKNQVDRRNQDYAEICRRIGIGPRATVEGLNGETWSLWKDGYEAAGEFGRHGIFETDHLIWLGDLNYRVDLTTEEVNSSLEIKDISTLLTYDQLIKEKKAGKVFQDFQEGPITFRPTYKYDEGTNTYDTSEKKRTPAWTDRILWRSKNASERIKLLNYSCCMELMLSDHKPVSALFEMKVKTIREEEQSRIRTELWSLLDRRENATMPDASLSQPNVEFGDVTYGQAISRSIVLENTGQVPAEFRFIPKLDEQLFCKSWLWVNPPVGMTMPGEKLTINFTILVDDASAQLLNTGEDSLIDVIILHLENGKDFFIAIQGNYLPTCFATRLDRLVRFPKAVRPAILEAKGPENVQLLGEDLQISVPRELWRIVDWIWMHGLSLDNLFFIPGDRGIMNYIRECLDSGVEFNPKRLLGDSDSSSVSASLAFPSLPSTKNPSSLSPRESLEAERTAALVAQIDDSEETTKTFLDADWRLRENQELGIHSMAETLLRFLEALPEPVIPTIFYNRCMHARTRFDADAILDAIPNVHVNTFLYITSFLREVIVKSGGDSARIDKLATIFSSIILRSPTLSIERNPEVGIRKRKEFLMWFLVSPDIVEEALSLEN